MTIDNDLLIKRHFKLGTTSFIVPDHIIPNVIKLGPFFDEIELLVFESRPLDVLPSKSEIKTLDTLSRDLNLTYNIHLPVDVSLTSDSAEKRQKASDALLRVIHLFSPLNPGTHTLHLEMPAGLKTNPGNTEPIIQWQRNAYQGLKGLLAHVSDPAKICVETLDYPFCRIESLVEQFNLSICLDLGHQIRYCHDFLQAFDTHGSRIPIIHLHGVDFSGGTAKDHRALDTLPESGFQKVKKILKLFTGVVSLEVFDLETLNRSLKFLSRHFQNIPPAVQ